MTTALHPVNGAPSPDVDLHLPVSSEVESIFNEIVKAYVNTGIDQAGLAVLVLRIMALVEKTQESGPAKKQMVIDIVQMLITKSGLVRDVPKFTTVAMR